MTSSSSHPVLDAVDDPDWPFISEPLAQSSVPPSPLESRHKTIRTGDRNSGNAVAEESGAQDNLIDLSTPPSLFSRDVLLHNGLAPPTDTDIPAGQEQCDNVIAMPLAVAANHTATQVNHDHAGVQADIPKSSLIRPNVNTTDANSVKMSAASKPIAQLQTTAAPAGIISPTFQSSAGAGPDPSLIGSDVENPALSIQNAKSTSELELFLALIPDTYADLKVSCLLIEVHLSLSCYPVFNTSRRAKEIRGARGCGKVHPRPSGARCSHSEFEGIGKIKSPGGDSFSLRKIQDLGRFLRPVPAYRPDKLNPPGTLEARPFATRHRTTICLVSARPGIPDSRRVFTHRLGEFQRSCCYSSPESNPNTNPHGEDCNARLRDIISSAYERHESNGRQV